MKKVKIMQTQKQGKQIEQPQLNSLLRENIAKLSNQSEANSFLQAYGLSSQMKDDSTIDILEASTKEHVATVQFNESAGSRSIKAITF